jgi:hypothetical protein
MLLGKKKTTTGISSTLTGELNYSIENIYKLCLA